MSQMIKLSFVATLFSLGGMIVSFLLSTMTAAIFGAGKDMDIYLVATTIPLFIGGIFANAISFSAIPALSEYVTRKPQEAPVVSSSFLHFNLIFSLILCAVAITCASPLVHLIAPGFDYGKSVKATQLLRLACPLLVVMGLNEIFISIFYVREKFYFPLWSKLMNPLFAIAALLMFYKLYGIKRLVISTLSGTFLQTLLLVFFLTISKSFAYRWSFAFNHPGIVRIVKLQLLLMAGMLFYRAVPLIDRHFLSPLPEGSISHVSYAFLLCSVISTVIVSGISTVLFPRISQFVVEKRWEEFKVAMLRGIKVVFFATIPFVIFLGPRSGALIEVIWQKGAFTAMDTLAVHKALWIYLFALPAMSMGTIVGQGFYALKDVITPVLVGIVEIIVYFFLCYFFVKQWGYLGVPLAYVAYFNFSFVVNSFFLRSKIRDFGKEECQLGFWLLKIFIAAAIPAVALRPIFHFVSHPFPMLLTILIEVVGYLFISWFLLEDIRVIFLSIIDYLLHVSTSLVDKHREE